MHINSLTIVQVITFRSIKELDYQYPTDRIMSVIDNRYHRHWSNNFKELIHLEPACTIECTDVCTMPPHRLDVGGFGNLRQLFNEIRKSQ